MATVAVAGALWTARSVWQTTMEDRAHGDQTEIQPVARIGRKLHARRGSSTNKRTHR